MRVCWCRYRAPECLLTDGYYNYKMDMWGVGCVMFEIVALYPLFPGKHHPPGTAVWHTKLVSEPQQAAAWQMATDAS